MRSVFCLICVLTVSLVLVDGSDNSTTTAPDTTTTKPTTTKPTTPTTTISPTTLAPSTTSAPPAPLPVPEIVKFNVSDSNHTCIEAEFALQFSGLSWHSDSALVVANATEDNKKSRCGDAIQILAITFPSDNRYQLELTFNKTGQEKALRSLVLVDTKLSKTETLELEAFKVDGDKSYHCEHSSSFTSGNVTVSFDHVKLAVFASQTGSNEVYNCPMDESVNDMVPIAVGCALLALVVIVLIAYFIGRRRSRRLAYQSV